MLWSLLVLKILISLNTTSRLYNVAEPYLSQTMFQTEENKTLSMSETLANNVIFEVDSVVDCKHAKKSFSLANCLNMVTSVVGGGDAVTINNRKINETIHIPGECVKLIVNCKNMM